MNVSQSRDKGGPKMPSHAVNATRLPAFRIKNGFALAAFAALLFAAPVARAQNAAPPPGEKTESAPPGNAESGKKIFTKDGCYECHGREGQGAAQGAGPRIGPLQLSFEAFTKYVHQPTGQMPPYTSKVISDQELADIYAYLQSRPKAAPSKDIPLLNQ
jgi:mono/diheme cytochrome c family protein